MIKIEISTGTSSDYISKKDYEENEEQLREQFLADFYGIGINTNFRDELFDRMMHALDLLSLYRGW